MSDEITPYRRKQRRDVLLHLAEHRWMSKAELVEITGAKHADKWLRGNADLPLTEDDGKKIVLVDQTKLKPRDKSIIPVRRRGEPLLRGHMTHNLGGIHALRG